MQYIPKSHIEIKLPDFSIWLSPKTQKNDSKKIDLAISNSYDKISRLGLLKPKRRINFCCYENYEEGCRILDRKIPSNMLMVPLSDTRDSLIVFFAPSISKTNVDKLARHLIHEIAHCFIYEKTSSTQILGDKNKNIKIDSRSSEGLCEIISYYALGKTAELEKIKPTQNASGDIDDLSNPSRKELFKIATFETYTKVKKQGLQNYFNSI